MNKVFEYGGNLIVEKTKKLELADLLGILVIILIVVGITVPVVLSLVRNSKTNASEALYTVIIDSAIDYAADNSVQSFALSDLLAGTEQADEITFTAAGTEIALTEIMVYVGPIQGYNDNQGQLNLRSVTLDFGFDEATDFDTLLINDVNVYDLENIIGDNNFFLYDEGENDLVLIDPKP